MMSDNRYTLEEYIKKRSNSDNSLYWPKQWKMSADALIKRAADDIDGKLNISNERFLLEEWDNFITDLHNTVVDLTRAAELYLKSINLMLHLERRPGANRETLRNELRNDMSGAYANIYTKGRANGHELDVLYEMLDGELSFEMLKEYKRLSLKDIGYRVDDRLMDANYRGTYYGDDGKEYNTDNALEELKKIIEDNKDGFIRARYFGEKPMGEEIPDVNKLYRFILIIKIASEVVECKIKYSLNSYTGAYLVKSYEDLGKVNNRIIEIARSKYLSTSSSLMIAADRSRYSIEELKRIDSFDLDKNEVNYLVNLLDKNNLFEELEWCRNNKVNLCAISKLSKRDVLILIDKYDVFRGKENNYYLKYVSNNGVIDPLSIAQLEDLLSVDEIVNNKEILFVMISNFKKFLIKNDILDRVDTDNYVDAYFDGLGTVRRESIDIEIVKDATWEEGLNFLFVERLKNDIEKNLDLFRDKDKILNSHVILYTYIHNGLIVSILNENGLGREYRDGLIPVEFFDVPSEVLSLMFKYIRENEIYSDNQELINKMMLMIDSVTIDEEYDEEFLFEEERDVVRYFPQYVKKINYDLLRKIGPFVSADEFYDDVDKGMRRR